MTEHNKTIVCYARGEENAYTLGMVSNTTAEVAYPSLAYNTPADGLYQMIDGIPYGSNSTDALISVSSVFITTNGKFILFLVPESHTFDRDRCHLGSGYRKTNNKCEWSSYTCLRIHRRSKASRNFSPQCFRAYVSLSFEPRKVN